MGEIAEMMLTGVLCEGCGADLDCEECAGEEIPAYCSAKCAKDRGSTIESVCNHNN